MLVVFLADCRILEKCLCRVIADGRTHIKTFNFWSSHPSAMTRCERLNYALYLDFGRYSFYLDFRFRFDGVQPPVQSGNLFRFSDGDHRHFGADRFSV